MKILPANNYTTAREAGGDDIARKRHLEQHYELNRLDLESYPARAFDTTEKIGLSMHSMLKLAENDADYYIALGRLVMDIEINLMSKPAPVKQQGLQTIVKALGYVIETSKAPMLINISCGLLIDMNSYKELEGFELFIHERKLMEAKYDYVEQPENSFYVENPSAFLALTPG